MLNYFQKSALLETNYNEDPKGGYCQESMIIILEISIIEMLKIILLLIKIKVLVLENIPNNKNSLFIGKN